MDEKFKKLLLLLVSDSSDNEIVSESSDEEENILLNITSECLVMNHKSLITKTSAEKRVDNYTFVQFKNRLGINKELAVLLSSKYEQSSIYQNIVENGLNIPTAKSQLYTFLWFMSSQNVSYRHVANFFGISLATVQTVLFKVATFLNNLTSEVIKWPDELQRKNSSKYYYSKTGVRGIIGVVGNIIIKADHSKKDYSNLNNMPVQAVCDENNKFIDVFIGNINHVVENTLLEYSNIIEKLNGLCDDEHIVGNIDFPCLPNLVTPISFKGELNYCLHQIEQCYEKLRKKFKHLNCLQIKCTKLKTLLIKACFVLYNLDLDCEDEIVSHHTSCAFKEHNYCVQ